MMKTPKARAAIEAMREPTEAMCMAGLFAAYNENPGEMWPAMINEALSTKES